MVLAVTIPFAHFVLTVGDGATPTEVFTAPCAFQSRSFVRNKNLQETVIPDCSDENKPGWIYRDPLSVSWGITGEGVMDEGSVETWDAWFLDAATRSVKITITPSGGSASNVVYTGKAHLQTLTFAANRGERMTFNVDIVGSGAYSETPAPTILGESLMEFDDAAAPKAKSKKVREAEAA